VTSDGLIGAARRRAIPVVQDFRLRAEAWRPGHLAECAKWWALDRRGRRSYEVLSERELGATRRSDTVFVFGSGKSLLDISPEEWARIGEHDTFGFNQFHEQRWVRVDYHLIAEVIDPDAYARSIRENERYADTVFCVAAGFLAHRGNELVGRRRLPERARLFRFRRVALPRYGPPSASFRKGVVHFANTTVSSTNFAALAGWKRIVLVGVDLYDKEYFWLPPGGIVAGEQPGRTADMRFPNADRTVDTFRRWRPLLERRGVELSVYNPRSLLAGALDVFAW
jgi:hypothetical protein